MSVLSDEKLLFEFETYLKKFIRIWGIKVSSVQIDLHSDIVSLTFGYYNGDLRCSRLVKVNIASIRNALNLEDYARYTVNGFVILHPELKMGFFSRLMNRFFFVQI